MTKKKKTNWKLFWEAGLLLGGIIFAIVTNLKETKTKKSTKKK